MAVITISREFGAGGKTLATKLAEKTGYTVVDQEIIEKVAREANVSTDWIKSIENESRGWLTKFMFGKGPYRLGYADPVVRQQDGYIDGHIYVELLHKIMPKIADEGDTIIVGRGGQYILRDREDTFHLLLVAKFEDRIRFMEETYKMSARQASMIVERMGKRRANLFQYFGMRDYNLPLYYHSVLNMSKVSMEKALEVVLALLEMKTSQ